MKNYDVTFAVYRNEVVTVNADSHEDAKEKAFKILKEVKGVDYIYIQELSIIENVIAKTKNFGAVGVKATNNLLKKWSAKND